MTTNARRSEDDPHMPPDLRALGFRLITDADGTMFAVSSRWGVSARRATAEAVWVAARQLVAHLRWMEKNGFK